jgi:hypothetical protein
MSISSARQGLSWFYLLRLLVLIFILYNAFSLAISLPGVFARLTDLEPGTVTGSAFYGWTAAQLQAVIESVGLRAEMYAALRLASSLVCLSSYWMMAGLLFWRKSNTLAGLLIAYVLFFTGPGFSGLLLIETQAALWVRDLDQLLAIFTWPTFFMMLYIFPNGKFVPRFTGYLFWSPYILFILGSLNAHFGTLGIVIVAAYAAGGLASQVYRYRKVSTLEERQQTKWVVFVLGLIILSAFLTPVLLVFFPSWVVGSPARFWYDFIGNSLLGVLLSALLPLAIGISIMRYRLWDIDLIIRRTLVYTVLTLMLGSVYFGTIIFLQNLLGGLTGERQPEIVTVISTLAIAALFTPLRRRIQAFIDRRFYRKKYNAEQSLADFALHARNETDLDQLTGQLAAVVQAAMQPEHTAVWLRAPYARPKEIH